jgi:hypothetical protein
MENTDKVLFSDDTQKWFIASPQGSGASLHELWEGPFTSEEVYKRLLRGYLSAGDFLWAKGQTDWMRILDIPEFKKAVPQKPDFDMIAMITKTRNSDSKKAIPPAPPTPNAEWFLSRDETQYGPFQKSEILRMVSVGQVESSSYVWKEGMTDWNRLSDLDDFKNSLKPVLAKILKGRKTESRKELRGSPRKPLLARLMVADGSKVIIGICRDVSIGGMQVLCDMAPETGSTISLNVQPTEDSGSAQPGGKIDPFAAKGVVVRVLEDGRGFSFRFEDLSDTARTAIQSYIVADGKSS